MVKFRVTNGEVYGKLYNWYAVAGIYDAASLNDTTLRKQLPPTGWHVPGDAEWTVLTDFLGGESIAGGAMKEAGTSHWNSPNTSATNSSGFTGLPGGYHSDSLEFYDIGNGCHWWSSSEFNAPWLLYRFLSYSYNNAYRYESAKRNGLSVRCLRD